MPKSEMGKGSEKSDKPKARLIVDAVAGDSGEEEFKLDIMHRPEAVGTENCAYLVFGIPGTEQYSFMDLNKLPEDMTVSVVVTRRGVTVSHSNFTGSSGNAPQR